MIRLHTLGRLHLHGASMQQRLPLLVLAWLLLEGPTERRRVRELFWPRSADPNTSMRVVLAKLRATLPDQAFDGPLLSARLPCDALDLADAEDPLALYAGEFLHGVRTDDLSEELQEWVVLRREGLAERVQLALLNLAERATTPAEAHRLAQAAHDVPGAPPPEPAALRRLLALVLPGTPLEARLRREVAEFDILVPPDPGEAPRPDLPGREREIAQILAFAQGPDPVLQIVGPAGIGKSALAVAALREAQATGAEVLHVDLEARPGTTETAAYLASALGVALDDPSPNFARLGSALADRAALVALDGADGDPRFAEALRLLVGAARGGRLRVLTTSRAPLVPEWPQLALGGLALPAPNAAASSVLAAPSVQVFLRSAEAHGAPPALDLSRVAAVVRRLQGMPLALRLAGGWLRHLTIDEVLRAGVEAGRGAADLSSLLAPLLARSWATLGAEERAALRRLALAPDWSVADAAEVASVTEDALALLARQGLAPREGDRVHVLPVLSAWLRGQDGDPDEDDALLARHAGRHLERLARLDPTDPVLAAERANVVQALAWRLRQGEAEAAAVERLARHYERLGLLGAGIEALAGLEAETDEPGLLAVIAVHRAWLAFRTGRARDAEGLAGRALDLARAVEGPGGQRTEMQAHNVLAVLHGHAGDAERAAAELEVAVRLARALGDAERAAVYLGNLAIQHKNLGRYTDALATLAAVREHHVAAGRPELALHDDLRALQVRLDDPDADPQAVRADAARLRAALPDGRAPQPRAVALLVEARAALRLRRHDEALALAATLERHLEAHPDPTLGAAAALTAAEAHYGRFDTPSARTRLAEAAGACRRLGDEAGLLDVLLVAADDLRGTDAALAARLASAVSLHARANAAQRRRARALLGSAAPEAPVRPLGEWASIALARLAVPGVTPTAPATDG